MRKERVGCVQKEKKAARGELQAPASWNLHLAPNQPDALIAQLKKEMELRK